MKNKIKGVENIMNSNKCLWSNKCQHGAEDCFDCKPENCVRFIPVKGTNLTKISGIVETPPGIDTDKFEQYFINWITSAKEGSRLRPCAFHRHRSR